MEDSSDASVLTEGGEIKSPIGQVLSNEQPETLSTVASPEESVNSESNDASNLSAESPEIKPKKFEEDANNEVKPLANEEESIYSKQMTEQAIKKDDGEMISEDENFKDNEDGELEDGEEKDDDELDFEEGEQTNSPKEVKKEENEDGEVDSEEDLEEGEVKEDDDKESNEASGSQLNNPSICRFYHKGLCTWGSSCRFVHNDPPNAPGFQKPNNSIANRLQFPGKSNDQMKMQPQPQPLLRQPNFIPKPPTVTNNQNYHHQMSQPPPNRMQEKSWDRNSNNYNNPKLDQYAPSNSQIQPQRSQRIERRDDQDFDRNNVYNSRPRFVDQPNDSSQSSYQSNYSRPRPSSNPDTNWESEYERKRRLAFEAAPWNDTDDTAPPPQRTPGLDRYGRPIVYSRDRIERNENSREPSSTRDPYRENSRDSSRDSSSRDAYGRSTRDAPEQFRDPWRRSKSPSSKAYPVAYKHSKSDSGSNFSENEIDSVPDARSEAHKRRLDPNFANKHRPSSFKDPPLPTSSMSVSSNGNYDSRPMGGLDSRKNYYNSGSGRDATSPPPSSSFGRGSPVYDKPNDKAPGQSFDRSNHVSPRTRRDSWSDSESTCSSSSYSGSGSGSSNSEPEHYSRTNKFESTRTDHKMKLKTSDKEYYANEPHSKKARLSEPDKYGYSKMAKAPKGPKSPDYSPRSPPNHSYSPVRANNMNDYGSPDDDYSNGQNVDKRSSKSMKSKAQYYGSSTPPPPPQHDVYLKSSKAHGRDRTDYHPRSPPPSSYPPADSERARKKKSSKSDDSSGGADNGDSKKIELLQQLKVIEEAIARKRSKLK